MVAQLRFPSAYNVTLPEATGTVVAFIRKESEFKLNGYGQYVEAPTMYGYYKKLGFDQPVRVPSVDIYDWPDGTDRPRGEMNKHPFVDIEFTTHRRDYAARLGYLELEIAKWQLRLIHMDDCISQAMTARTQRVYNLFSTVANWGANTATANVLNGGAGSWKNASDDPLSPNYNAIFKTLSEVRRRIGLATNMKVKPNQMQCIVSPQDAINMAQSGEMTNYLRQQEGSKDILENGLSHQQELWGLPEYYKGFKMMVEDAPIVTEYPTVTGTAPGNLVEATTNRSFIWTPGTAIVTSRVGALDGEYGARSFSTLSLFHYGSMLEMQAFDHAEDRFVTLHATENITEALTAPPSGFQILGV
jgi:hypothetical protein